MVPLLALSLLLPVIALAGCSKKQEQVDPKQTLDQSAAAMKALKSFHVTYDVQRPSSAKPLPGLDIVGITGDVAGEGEMKATIDVLQDGVPIKLEFVASGPLQYLQNPTTNKWQSFPAAFSPVGQLNLNAGAIDVLERIANPTYVGKEDVGGTPTYHFKGSVKGEDIAKIVAALSATGTYNGDIWIGVDDHLVRRIRVEGAVAQGEDPKTVRTVELSKFNEPVTITPPVTSPPSSPTTSPPTT